ncbi:MAG: DNA polymerase III subunit chi [Pseudomonadota bacterium]
MTEVLFYHLEHQPLERVLPTLLERTLERGWRAVIQSGNQERLEALDTHLWTYRDESFLPHGVAKDANAAQHPIVLTLDDDNPNEASVRFLVDGATGNALEDYTRVVYLFDGRLPEAVQQARDSWKEAKSAGFDVTYWQQTSGGKWERKA